MSSSHKTTFNTGDIIPIYTDSDILPGDTVQIDVASLVRMATPIYPVMDNLFLDLYWFYVPHRLVWSHFKEFWGENEDPWARETEYQIPQINPPIGGWEEGTIADYMGLPTKVAHTSVSALPFRAYCRIWNDFFRDQNLKKAAHIYTDETTRMGVNSGDYVTSAELGGKPLKAAKLHDFFTSMLPNAQKGPSVALPLSGEAGVKTGPINTDWANWQEGIRLTNKLGTSLTSPAVNNSRPINITNVGTSTSADFRVTTYTTNNTSAQTPDVPTSTRAATEMVPINLYADLSNATAATVAQLRTAFAIQKYYENAGLHGTRYIEYIRSVFGITSSDARMQRAEYLGGKRVPLNIDQVLQTSSTNETSPQGNTAGFSCTFDKHSAFTKSFEEHGTLMCLAVVRTEHTYQQGIDQMWKRKTWEQFYNPFFAHLSEEGITNETIYAQTAGIAANVEIFGYQERWASYRYHNSKITGYMRSNATGSLDVWHFGDKYDALPTLGTTWIDEPYTNVDRVIAVTSQLTHQFLADFYFKAYYTRPMPVYSVPGLIDHV